MGCCWGGEGASETSLLAGQGQFLTLVVVSSEVAKCSGVFSEPSFLDGQGHLLAVAGVASSDDEEEEEEEKKEEEEEDVELFLASLSLLFLT